MLSASKDLMSEYKMPRFVERISRAPMSDIIKTARTS